MMFYFALFSTITQLVLNVLELQFGRYLGLIICLVFFFRERRFSSRS